jgi:3-oxoacyl-[acyl-carrier protein] reductase
MQPARFLITGGSQGIGAAVVELACRAGHQVVFTGRNQQHIEAIAQKTGAYGVRADISVADDNARTFDVCTKRMGGVDMLVNNAAYAYRAEIGALDVGRMKEMFDTNVFGLVDMTNRVVPQMKARALGDVVNIASTSGMKGAATATPYAASKWWRDLIEVQQVTPVLVSPNGVPDPQCNVSSRDCDCRPVGGSNPRPDRCTR